MPELDERHPCFLKVRDVADAALHEFRNLLDRPEWWLDSDLQRIDVLAVGVHASGGMSTQRAAMLVAQPTGGAVAVSLLFPSARIWNCVHAPPTEHDKA